MGKKVYFLFLFLLIGFIGLGQSITIDNTNFQVGSYGQNSTIAVPFKVSGCFADGNSFQLYISNDGFTTKQLIGSFNTYFTTFINGTIPSTLQPGNYQLRIESTIPAVVSSTTTSNIQVVASSNTLLAKINTSPSRILSDQLYFGWCSGSLNNNQIIIDNQSTSGSVVNSYFINEKTGVVTNPIFTANQTTLTLARNYFTYIIKASNGGVISSKAYNIINSPNRLTLSTDGEQVGCLPDTLSFNLNIDSTNGIGDNFPLQKYKLDWGDGTATEIYKHCELLSTNGAIRHLYNSTSCSQTSIGFNVQTSLINTFYSTTGILQNCDQPIVTTRAKIFKKPVPDFNFISPGCVNTNIIFTNTTDPGLSQNGPACSSLAYYSWYVDGVLVSQSNLVATPPNLNYVFTTSGFYSIKLSVDNGSCQIVSITKTICIQPSITSADFLFDDQGVLKDSIVACAPKSFGISNLTPAVLCGPNSYTWSVSYESTPGSTISSGVIYTISSNTAPEPTFNFLTPSGPGRYLVNLRASNVCGNKTISKKVIIIGVPTVSFPSNKTYCSAPKTINFLTDLNHKPNFNTTGGSPETYAWTITGGSFNFVGGTSASSQYPQIQFNDNVTYTITLLFTSSCGSATATQQITFNQPVTANAGIDTTVCFNINTINLIGVSSGPAGYSIAWTTSGTGSFSPSNTAANPTYNISSGDKASGTVTLTFTATPPAGNVCPVVPNTRKITIRPENKITNASNQTICSGITFNYSPAASPTGQGAFTFNYTSSVTAGSASGNTATGSGSISDVLVNNSSSVPAVVTYTITATKDGCNGTPSSFTVTINPKPATPTATANTPICSGNILNLTASSTTPGVSYAWSGPNSFTSSSQNPNISNISVAGTGTYNVTATLNSCVSLPGSVAVVVNQTPVQPTATSNSPVCSGSTLTLNTSTTTSGVSYAWTGPNSFISALQSPSISNVTAAAGGSYSVTATLGTCTSTAGNVTVTIKPTPDITSTTSTNPTSCNSSTGTIVLNGLSANTSYTVNFTKNGLATTATFTSNSSGVLTITGLTAGTYTNIFVTLNGCISNIIAGPINLSDPNPPATPTATTNAPICSGTTLNLNASTTSIGSITYNWTTTASSGFTSTTQNPTILNATTAYSGTYSVIATLNSCKSLPGNVVVVVDSTPAKPVLSSNSPVCSGSTLNLTSTSTFTGAPSTLSYLWSGPNSFTSYSKDTSLLNVTTAASGNYSLVITSKASGCSSLSGTISVWIKPTPVLTGTTKTDPTNCNTSTGTITLSGLTKDSSYTVNYSKNGVAQAALTLTADASGNILIANLSAGTYTNFSVVLRGCQSNTIAGPITLSDPNPPATPTATTNAPICSGTTLNLNASTTSIGSITYNWTTTASSGFTSTTQNPTILNATTAYSGTYSVIATLNSCKSLPGNVVVVVDSTPAKPVLSSNTPLCFGSTINLTSVTNFPGAPSSLTYSWTGPNGFSSNTQNPVISTASELTSGLYVLQIKANSGNCLSDTASTNVLVRPKITQALVSGPDTIFVCNFAPPANAIQNIAANLNSSRPYEKGKWTIINQPTGGNGIFANDQANTTTFTYSKSGLYQLQWAISNDLNCPSTKDTLYLSIVDKPVISQSLTTTATNVCAGNPVTISIPSTAVVGDIKYWQYKIPYNATSWTNSTTNNPSITFNNVQDTFKVRLVVISTDQIHCSGDTAFKEILINVAPPSSPGVTSGVDTVCKGSNSGTIVLAGNIGSPFWQSSTDGINFSIIPLSSAQTYTYTNLIVTTWFRAAVKSGVCDTVFSNATKITIFPPVTPANAGVDISLCGATSYQLNANVPGTNETGLWSLAATSPIATINSASSPNTFISNLVSNNNYQLIWTLSNNICPNTRDTVIIKNYLPLTNTIDTATITVCNGVTVNVTGNLPIGGSAPYFYQWQIFNGSSWDNIPGALLINYSFVATTTIKIRRLVNATPCSDVSLEKTIYVQPPLSNNTINGNIQTCINTSPGVLTGSLPTGADGNYTYLWQTGPSATGPWTNATGVATQKDYTAPVLTTTTYYRRFVTSALCNGNQGLYSLPYQIIVRPNAIAQWVITKDTACKPFNINNTVVSPVINTITNSSYSWYANNVFYGNSATINPGYTLNNAGDSVTIKMVAVSLYGCKNDSLQHKFFTIPPVLTAFTMSDSVGCGPLTVGFTNNTPNIGFFTYAWDFGNNQTSILAQPNNVTFQSNPNFGDTTYFVKLTATSKCESVIKTKSITVKSKPKSIFTPSKTTGCSPLTVTFTNLSKGLGVNYIWNFDDGTVLSIASPQQVTHTFNSAVQDTFRVKLIAINSCGNDTSLYNIVVSPNTVHLDFAVNGNEKQGCKPHTVKFINASSGATNFQWNFGDGNTLNTIKNTDTITHTFLQAGTFAVSLFASNGCSDTTSTELIQVFNPPSVNFAANPITACIGDTIRFTNQSDTTTSLLWNFKDGYTSSVTNPVHAYAAAGIYNVQLKAIRQYNSGLSCADSISKSITIVSKLPGYFSVSDSVSNCVPFTVTFTNNSLPSSLTVWTFAPGVTDTGNVVTHTFTQVGTYNVKMVAKHPGGCSYEYTKNIVVRGPVGTMVYDHGNICKSNPVKFSAIVSGTDSIRWNFGDGSFATTVGTVIYHTYNQPGYYVPTATLYSNINSNCTISLNGLDTIKIDEIKAGYKFSSQQNCGSTNVQFTDTSRHFLPIANWQWNFGDGTTSNLQNPQHAYSTSNTYTIQLIVTATSGCSDTTTKFVYIKVNNKPVNVIAAPLQSCTDNIVNYMGQINSVDSVTIVNWIFSNGFTSSGYSSSNVYIQTGTYTATLISATIYGCTDTTKHTIVINPTPNVIATTDQLICKSQSLQLNATGASTYIWSPINGSLSCIACPNPVASPLTTTQYVVTGTNTFGCSNKDTVKISVAQPIRLTVSASDTICNGGSTQLSASGATTYLWSPALTLNQVTSATPIATPIATTKYQVIGFDNHNCFQDTGYVTVAVGQYPTVNLGNDKTLTTGTQFPLMSTITNGPITKWLWSPATDLNCTTCPQPIAVAKKAICYSVVATNQYHCSASDTICIKVFCENTQVFIPNGFTPDGDGINDVLMVRGTGIKLVKNFRIFNRWGQVVFEKNNFIPNDINSGWDGTFNGKPALPDVYVYTCDVTCENDISYTYKGNVSIIK